MKYDLPGLSLSTKRKDYKHRKWAGMRLRGSSKLAKLEVFKGFLSMLLTVRNVQKGVGRPTKNESILRPDLASTQADLLVY